MGERFERKSLKQLAWPIFIELTLFMLMGMVDTFMISAYSQTPRLPLLGCQIK